MEIHSVLPEERAQDPKGETLPWGYRYADSTRNIRQPDELGPFGRNRSLRATGSRTSRTRGGTTPVRQKENSAVLEFGKLFAKEQARDEEERSSRTIAPPTATAPGETTRVAEPEAIATECMLYGYAGKASEWKVLSKYEKIVAPSIICEDYPREDPNLFLSSNSPLGQSRSAIVVHRDLSRDALRKSRIYKGGQHWIKITFDSNEAAERACSYSPIEVDGYQVFCEIWEGRGPVSDVAIPASSGVGDIVGRPQPRTLGVLSSRNLPRGKQSAVAGFERAMQTLPRSHTVLDVQYGQPPAIQDDISVTSTTASSATATDLLPLQPQTPALRSRSVPQLPSQLKTPDPSSQYMTHIPSVKRAVLRPASEALLPHPTFSEKIVRYLPLVSRFAGSKGTADVIAEGPSLKDDGSWDPNNGWYWSFWHSIDTWIGTDFCGLKDD